MLRNTFGVFLDDMLRSKRETFCADYICALPKDPGDCDKTIPRWYYNGNYRRCFVFAYSGCSGNDNNFDSPAACTMFCSNDKGRL